MHAPQTQSCTPPSPCRRRVEGRALPGISGRLPCLLGLVPISASQDRRIHSVEGLDGNIGLKEQLVDFDMLRSVLDLSNPMLSIGAQNNIANAQVPSRNGLLLNAVP